MLEKFRAFVMAQEIYQSCKKVRIPNFLYDQLIRASSSVALNLAEGSVKRTQGDQKRFNSIALGSLRECEAILLLENVANPELKRKIEALGAILYKLSSKVERPTESQTNSQSLT
jgi:four helix bundle protein